MYFICVLRPGQDRFRSPNFHLSFIYIFAIFRLFYHSSCLFFDCLQALDLRGQVDRAPTWSITYGDWFSDCEGAMLLHVSSWIVRVVSTKSIVVSHRKIGTPRLYQVVSVFRLLGENSTSIY